MSNHRRVPRYHHSPIDSYCQVYAVLAENNAPVRACFNLLLVIGVGLLAGCGRSEQPSRCNHQFPQPRVRLPFFVLILPAPRGCPPIPTPRLGFPSASCPASRHCGDKRSRSYPKRLMTGHNTGSRRPTTSLVRFKN